MRQILQKGKSLGQGGTKERKERYPLTCSSFPVRRRKKPSCAPCTHRSSIEKKERKGGEVRGPDVPSILREEKKAGLTRVHRRGGEKDRNSTGSGMSGNKGFTSCIIPTFRERKRYSARNQSRNSTPEIEEAPKGREGYCVENLGFSQQRKEKEARSSLCN